MGLHGRGADRQQISDLLGRARFGHQMQHLALPLRERGIRVERARVGGPARVIVEYDLCDRLTEERLSSRDGCYGLDEFGADRLLQDVGSGPAPAWTACVT
jgi:hypothetical protein